MQNWNRCALAISIFAVSCGAIAQDAASITPVSSEGVAALAEAARGYVAHDSAVGWELLVIQDGQVLLHETCGMADRETERPWTFDTISNIRSMSKTVTGAAAQILIDRGRLALDDRVAQYLPGFDNERSGEITIEQLLTHRSGLPLTILESAVDEYPTLQAQANAAGERGPDDPPGSKFWYSDIATDALGAVVEVVSGQLLNEFVEAEIFEPLGMDDSFYAIDPADERFSRIASLYVGQGGEWMRFWTPEDAEAFYPCAWGSQTIYSTPLDYAKFLSLFMNDGMVGDRRVLSSAAVERTLTPVSEMRQLGSDDRFPCALRGLGAYYGQMMQLYCPEGAPDQGTAAFGHSGSDGTIAWVFPDRNLIVEYFTQSRGGLSALRIEEEVDRLLLHPGEGAVAEEIPERFSEYIGAYIANFGPHDDEEFRVVVKNGALTLDIPSQLAFELLEPDDNGLWAFKLAPDQAKVSFERDEEGRVDLLRIHQGPMLFDVPRAGTPLAEKYAQAQKVTREEIEPFVGAYRDDENDRLVEIFIDEGGVLNVKAPPNLVLQLRPNLDHSKWEVRLSPGVMLSFQRDEDGKVVSMTRHVGEDTLVMPRAEKDEPVEP